MDQERINDMADELAENGMGDAADALREDGAERALEVVEDEIAFLSQYPDSDQLTGNLEMAREILTNEVEAERMDALSDATANLTEALRVLYDLYTGDGAAVGEILYECDKAARSN